MSGNAAVSQERVGVFSKNRKRLLELLLDKQSGHPKKIRAYPRAGDSARMRMPASGAQQRLWFIDQLEGGSTAYHIPMALRVWGELNQAALQMALNTLIKRHEVLRTGFTKVDGEPAQEIMADASIALKSVDLSSAGPEERDEELARQARDELAAPFDLRAGLLIRGTLFQLSRGESLLLLTMHHIISDGWSVGVLVRELGLLYDAYCAGESDPLSPLPIQYADYVQWQRQWLLQGELHEQLNYWEAHLRGAPALLELPTDRRRPALRSYRGTVAQVALSERLTAQLRTHSRKTGLTLAMSLYAAWAILMSRLSGQDDVVVGMPVANRRRVELEGLIGFFVNTLALRTQLTGDRTVTGFLRHVREIMLAAYANQDTPFEKVVERVQPERSLSYSPIFQVMFVMQNAPRGPLQSSLTLVEQATPLLTAKFDLTLSLQESDSRIVGTLNYATDLFDAATIDRWIGYFTTIVEQIVQERHQTIDELSLLSSDERRKVLSLFNSSEYDYPKQRLAHELFEMQVERSPGSVAALYQGQAITFAELNAKSNKLARHLRERGVGPDQLVALCVERGLEMVVALLGILKAGGAYVPLDPDYPAARLAYVLQDAAPRVLLIQDRLRDRMPETDHEVVSLDGDWNEIERQPGTNLGVTALGLRSSHLAYVIYTSGSTGRSKGVMVDHANVLSLWQGLKSIYGGEERSKRIAVNASINFDSSVKQIVQILSGHALVPIPYDCRLDAALLMKYVKEHEIDVIDCTPGQLRSWLSVGLLDASQGHGLSLALVGGEPIDAKLWSRLAGCAETAFYNVYGPTESTVDTTYVALNGDDTSPHIGRPMDNRSVYILDGHLQPVPIGAVGEIYIGGAGVARGYLNRPQLTAERFLPDPFGNEAQARMYKTGDLARWRGNGTIEYLRRNDFQVKVRGFRIELGEIESQLLENRGVDAAAVIVREDTPGEPRLVAYVVPADRSAVPSVEELRDNLKAALPEYMMPSALVVLESMPRTPNGKLDWRALPAPGPATYATRGYEAPQGEKERILAEIWQSLLHADRVGRRDNFFELGGHSLMIMQVMERLREAGLSADVRQVFERPTLADLANELTSDAAERNEVARNLIPAECESIVPQMLTLIDLNEEHIAKIVRAVRGGAANIQDVYPLAPLQEGILFHHLMKEGGNDTYIVPILLTVSSRQRLDELIDALQAVIDRHDILRTAVLWEELPQPVQVVYRRVRLPVEELVLDKDRDPTVAAREWIRPERQRMDPRYAPLIRLQVAAGPVGQWYALLQTHHLISDHVTLEVVISEVVSHLEGRIPELVNSPPYREHVAQAIAYSKSHDAEEFFRGKLADVDEPTAPFGLLDVHGEVSHIEQAREGVDPDIAKRVRAQARRLGVSSAALFHVGWALVVAHTSGRNDVVFGSVLLGRLRGQASAQQVLGMFINSLPLRLRLEGISAQELVEQTQRELVELLTHEQASLAVAQRCSGIVGSAPLFTSLFNYRHSVANPEAQWSRAKGVQMIAGQDWTNYPITFSVDDEGQGFSLTAQTDRRIDPHRVTRYMHTALQSLVEALEQAPRTRALSLPILPPIERLQVLEQFNGTLAQYPQDKLIHQLFEDQVLCTPDAVAVKHGIRHLTYAELNASANRLARQLISKGVRSGCLVGICVERGIEMAVGVLAILKAGSAYLPLDPSYPPDRLSYILNDAAPALLLSQKNLRDVLLPAVAPIVDIHEELQSALGYSEQNLPADAVGITVSNLVYVIYTSGSTGRPKGVAMPHGAMANLMEWHHQNLPLGAGRRVTQFAALSFDVAFQEIFSTLRDGGTLVMLDEWVRKDARAMLDLIRDQSIERLFMPPLMLQSLAEHSKMVGDHELGCLKTVIVAGEQLRITAEMVDFFAQLPECSLHNHYGPTETHVVTSLTLADDPRNWPVLPSIGRPIANTQIYILDSERAPVPVGVSGEVYIGGANLACGYLGRPDLTEERFLRDPFKSDPKARLYKTGDLGRWRADGTVEYQGRNDDQVKIRGYRIELTEVEAHLAKHAEVKDAAVIVREAVPGEKRLVAYATLHAGSSVNGDQLREHIRSSLPEFMVPSVVVILESMPTTPSGKLNRRALPAPDVTAFANQTYDAPQGRTEEALAQAWAEVLNLNRIGREDNFFELGGHSLLVLKLLFKINQVLGATLRVADIYKHSSIRQQAAYLSGAAAEDRPVSLSEEAALDDDIVGLPARPPATAKTVLFTGGSGFVGRFLLAHLLHATDATVYCLIREPCHEQAWSRIRNTLVEWDLWHESFASRLFGVSGDLRLARLGLDEVTYQRLCRNVDTIYHCGTSMNHLETYAMAKSANVESAKELLKLASTERPKVINYISTLGIFGPSTTGMTRVVDEETSIDHEAHLSSRGYVASKWVAEKIFMQANARGIPCNIFRVGLVWADSVAGRYDELQRVYRVIKSSLLSGYAIQNYRFDMSPIPVDYASRAIVALADKYSGGGGVFHISSSEPALEDVFERCNEVVGTSLELVPFYEWVCQMRDLHNQGRSMPVAPLIAYAFSMDEKTFYEHQRRIRAGLQFDCERTTRLLADAGIVTPRLSDEFLKTSVESMFARDAQLRETIRERRGEADSARLRRRQG